MAIIAVMAPKPKPDQPGRSKPVTSTRPWLPWPRFSPSPDHNLPWEYAWLPQNVAVHPRHESSIVEIEPFTVAVEADFDLHGTDRDRRSR